MKRTALLSIAIPLFLLSFEAQAQLLCTALDDEGHQIISDYVDSQGLAFLNIKAADRKATIQFLPKAVKVTVTLPVSRLKRFLNPSEAHHGHSETIVSQLEIVSAGDTRSLDLKTESVHIVCQQQNEDRQDTIFSVESSSPSPQP